MAQGNVGTTPGSGQLLELWTPTSSTNGGQQGIVIGDGTNNGRISTVHVLGALNVNLAASQSLTATVGPTTLTTTLNNAVTHTNIGQQGNGSIQISGGSAITTASLVFEASVDGTNFVPIDVTRSDSSQVINGLIITNTNQLPMVFNFIAPGYASVRVRVAATATATTMPSVTITGGPFLYDPSPAVPQLDGNKTTYTAGLQAAAIGTPFAGDVMVLTGSATRLIRVTRIDLSMTGTGAINTRVSLIKRTTADTGGTAGTAGNAPTLGVLDSNDAATTATSTFYTAVPTAGTVGAIVGGDGWFTSAAGTVRSSWEFGERPSKCPVLRGTTQQLAVNLSTATGTAQTWAAMIEYTEEAY